MKEFCRNIDRVTVKGSEKPIRLYTVDLCYERLSKPIPNHIKYPDGQTPPTAESKRALNLEYLKEEEIPNYSAKVLPPPFRNLLARRGNSARPWSTACPSPSRRASTWEARTTLRASGAMPGCSTYLLT